MKKYLIFICFILLLFISSCNNYKTNNITKTTSKRTSSIFYATTCNHNLVTLYGKEATCTEDGLTDGLYCSKCNKIFKAQQIIEKHHVLKIDGISLSKVKDYDKAISYKCENCDYHFVKELEPSDIHIPIITFNGSLDDISKENKVQVNVKYESEDMNFESIATLKLQGNSSLYYPKKNYTIQFLNEDLSKNKIRFIDAWGKESKYCLKANYIDFTQARNVVSAKLYGEVVHSRNINDKLNSLVNGGAIDGFPVIIYNNNDFLGLYTLNIPKDKWLFGMGKGEKEAILQGDNWSNTVRLQEKIDDNFSDGIALEYSSTEDAEWIVNSFNNMIDFLNNATYLEFINHANEYIDVDRAIDSMLYTMVICAPDNVGKNILYITYDGEVWIPSVYDMDGVMGLYWNGDIGTMKYNDLLSEVTSYNNHLWEVLYKYKKYEISLRYFELRESILSIENIKKEYDNFVYKIDPILYETDKIRWNDIPSVEENTIDYLIDFMDNRLNLLDEYFKDYIH